MRQGIYRKGKKMSNISVKKVILVHLTAAAVTAVYVLSPIKCPVKYFLHFDCPTCGMTRAMISLLRGDIAGYMHFNPMALPFLLVLLFALHARLFPLKPAVKNAVIITGAVCTFAVYLLRIVF